MFFFPRLNIAREELKVLKELRQDMFKVILIADRGMAVVTNRK